MTWRNKLKCVFKLQFERNKGYLLVYMIIQALIALGVAVGYSYLFSEPNSNDLLYLATGSPTIVLIMTALVTVPMQNANLKTEGYIDYIKSLSVSRKMFLFVDVGIWLAITVPGITIALAVTNFIFRPEYAISWTLIPSLIIIVLACFGIGYGYSFVMNAEHAMALSQVIAFTALMFSPINYPIDRLPMWLQYLHRALPIYPMSEVMRASLAHTSFSADPLCYVVLTIWAFVGFFGAIRFLEKA